MSVETRNGTHIKAIGRLDTNDIANYLSHRSSRRKAVILLPHIRQPQLRSPLPLFMRKIAICAKSSYNTYGGQLDQSDCL